MDPVYPPEKILLLGDPGLRLVCAAVHDFNTAEFGQNAERLVRALAQFRAAHGFGRAIAAPQIGMASRMIAMNLGSGPFLLVNPEISLESDDQFTLWDDCMSFPWLMVRVRRYLRVSLRYCDERGNMRCWNTVERAVAELLQHEIDHLDGILAVDRALDRDAIISRELYLQRKEYFDRQVDYTITPTIQGGAKS